LTNKNIAYQQNAEHPDVLNDLIVDAIQDIKGKDIVKFDLRQLEESSTDFFIICHGNSNTQIAGIINNVEKRVYDTLGIRPNHSEGKQSKSWMLVDYFSVVVHVFSKDKREFYNIEDLWSDAAVTSYDNIA